MSDIPVWDLHIEGRPLHPPQDFDPASEIGQAYADKLAAEQAAALAQTQLTAAEQELGELKHFVENAGVNVNMKRFGEARDRAELLERNVPHLRAAQAHTERVRERAHISFANIYGQYAGFVRAYNGMVAGGLNWNENPRQYFSQWVHEIQTFPDRIAVYETQLKEAIHE